MKPNFVSGEVSAPPSKSFSHRALFAAALSRSRVRVGNLIFSDDISACADCVKSLGAKLSFAENSVFVDGKGVGLLNEACFNAGESGTALRFIIPVAVMLGGNFLFEGKGRLPHRPIDEYYALFDENGVEYTHPDGVNLPLVTKGTFKNREFGIKCDKSSQYASGLMLCGMVSPVTVRITSEIASKPYLDITCDVLRDFGCDVCVRGKTYKISPPKSLVSEYTVEGDWSQAAFYLCAAAINGEVTVKDVKIPSSQGDFAIVDILKSFGADITLGNGCVTVKKSSLFATSFDAHDIPDLVPVLCVLSCFAKGETVIENVANLKLKESDRIAAITEEIIKLGGKISFDGNNLKIQGVGKLKGGATDSHGDHRIAMSMAVASVGCEESVEIYGYKSVNKSYPAFFDDWSSLNE